MVTFNSTKRDSVMGSKKGNKRWYKDIIFSTRDDKIIISMEDKSKIKKYRYIKKKAKS